MTRPTEVILATVLATTLLISNSVAQESTKPTPPTGDTFHHRVLWMHNPSSEAVLSWTTREAGTNHRVYYGTESKNGTTNDYPHSQSTFLDGRFTVRSADVGWVEPAHYHHVHLTGLEPSTTYFVVFASDDKISREFHFITAPASDEEFTVLAGGDSRIGGSDPYDHTDRQKMNVRIAKLFQADPSIIALVHGGDYCQLAEWRYLEPWLTDHELTTTSSGRMLPIIPARGNHDRAEGFVEMFPWPGHDGNYYYDLQLSSQVALVTLNTEISLGGDQRDWLDATLARLRPANRWVMVQYHRPAYSSVRNIQDGAGRRDNWVPLFEKYNVDLVYESHDHALKRTLPIRNGAPDLENGIVYVGDGGLGVPQRTPDTMRWWLQSPGFARSAHHVHTIAFSSDGMKILAHGMDGELLDDYSVAKQAVGSGVEGSL